jgi:hypothetical protein
MKKIFTLMMFAVSASAMMAQSNPKVFEAENSIDATMSEFSANGKAQMYIKNYDDSNGKEIFTFYADDFTQQGELIVQRESFTASEKMEQREWQDDGMGHAGYTGDWKTIYDESNTIYGEGTSRITLKDFNQSCDDFRSIYLSQTIFNNDDKYEYIMPVYKPYSMYEERDEDGDGTIDTKDTRSGMNIVGFKIVSETGNVLSTVNFEEGFGVYDLKFDLILINGKRYLSISGNSSYPKRVYYIYSIESEATSVSMKSVQRVAVSARYTLDGRRTQGERGINIIRMEDGTVKKVFVK